MRLKLGTKIVLFLLVVGVGAYVVKNYLPHSKSPIFTKSDSDALLTLSGSNTVGADLAPKLARAFLQDKGAIGIEINRLSPDSIQVKSVLDGKAAFINVNARGSATAFTDLASGKCDIGMASRPVTVDEATKVGGKMSERVIGLDGVVIVVNKNLSVRSMNKSEIAKAFTGDSFNVYARDEKSGTYDLFKNLILHDLPLPSGAKRFDNSESVVKAVATDPRGIGFTSLSAVHGNVNVLAVADSSDSLPVTANQTTIRTETYPLTRRLFLYTTDKSSPIATEFVNFAASQNGQTTVEDVGFVAQKVTVIKQAVASTAAPEYKSLAVQNERLDVDLRFETGSSNLDSKAADDIGRIIDAVKGRSLVLVGFSDSTGSATTNIALSKQRADAVAAIFTAKGVTPVEVKGLGPINPVATNGTPEGREKNRRVEVWVR